MPYTREQQDAGNMIESAISYLIWMTEDGEAHEFLRAHSFNLKYNLSDAWDYSEKWGEIYRMILKIRQETKDEAKENYRARLFAY